MPETLRHKRWERTGRTFEVLDDLGQAIPNKFALTTRIGEHNVDLGDGTFAPYVLDGATLRHGDSECEFADGWQTIKRLGQTLVSKSRLYIQRDIAGVWTDVPHGVPTRNVAHDYPKAGKCTAYLDFPDIQGYAQGARLQVGIEVGGSGKEIFGFRMRSPVAGSFRLEWVLEIPEDVDLSWIKVPTSRTDPTPIRIGGRIGQTEIRWSNAEAPFRSAIVEPDGLGGRILHLFLGPYTLSAQQWLTVYPDTLNAGEISANYNDGMGDTGYVDGYQGVLFIDDSDTQPAWGWIGWRWEGINLGGTPASIDSGTVITFDSLDDNAGANGTIRFVAENAQDPVDFVTHVEDRTYLTASGKYVDHSIPDQARDDESYSMVAPIQALITAGFTYNGSAGHDTLVLACGANNAFGITAVSFRALSYDNAHASGQPARLTIVYTVAASATIDQLTIRARNDDNDEANASWAAVENAMLTAPAGTMRFRFQLNNTGDPAAITPQFDWERKPSGGAWGTKRKIR